MDLNCASKKAPIGPSMNQHLPRFTHADQVLVEREGDQTEDGEKSADQRQ